jgi:hypothetical protein
MVMVEADNMHEKAVSAACAKWDNLVSGLGRTMSREVRIGIKAYLAALPRPELPYDQAVLYRKLVGM